MDELKKPYLIEFPRIGDDYIGYISVVEQGKIIPFKVKRVYWTYQTPEFILRGRHAHYSTEQILIAVNGKITVTTELQNGEINIFTLDKPNLGLYIPPNAWHTMQYTENAVQLVLASTIYNEDDYIRSYDDFKKNIQNNL